MSQTETKEVDNKQNDTNNKKIGKLSAIHHKLSHSIEQMMIDPLCYYPYYSEMCSFINFYKTDFVPTCGVNFSHSSMQFFWNQTFLDELDQKEVNFVVIHELFHLLFSHYQRTIKGGYHPVLANYAQDMIINEIIISDITSKFVKIPESHPPILMPKEYTGERVFEILYAWLRDKKSMYDQWKQQQQSSGDSSQDSGGSGGSGGDNDDENSSSDENGKGKSSPNENGNEEHPSGCPVSKELKQIFDNMDAGKHFDVHMDDDVPPEVKEQMVKDMIESIRNRGLSTNNMEETLSKLRKSKKNYLSELKRMIAQTKGKVKEPSWKRPNRRGLEAFKGKIKKSNMINCIIDTSGSMHGYFEKVLSYIFHDGYAINFIQCDTEIKDSVIIHSKKDLQRVKIQGLGGTMLQPGIDFIKENKFQKYSTVVLTDGYCDSLDFSGLSKSLIITCGTNPNFTGNNVKCVVIEE